METEGLSDDSDTPHFKFSTISRGRRCWPIAQYGNPLESELAILLSCYLNDGASPLLATRVK